MCVQNDSLFTNYITLVSNCFTSAKMLIFFTLNTAQKNDKA